MEKSKRTIQAEKTKEDILLAAMAILGSEGQSALSASNIAKKAGIGKATIFHHFSTMDDLVFSIMTYFFQNFTEEVEEIKSETPEKFLLSIGNKAVEETLANKELIAAFLSFYEKALHDEKYKNLFKIQFEYFFEYVAVSLQNYYSLKIPKKEKRLLSMMTTFVCDGMGIYYQIFSDQKLFKEYWGLYTKMLVLYLEKYKKKET